MFVGLVSYILGVLRNLAPPPPQMKLMWVVIASWLALASALEVADETQVAPSWHAAAPNSA